MRPTSGSFADMFERKEREEPTPAPIQRPPERIASPFKDALGSLKKQLQADEKQRSADKAAQKNAPPAPVKPVARKPRADTGGLAEDEATALSLAMQGVKPLGSTRAGRVGTTARRVESRTAMVAPFGKSAEEEARARLDQLVAQDVSFRIERDRDYVRGARIDAPARVLRELARRTRASEQLDLHGMTQREAHDAVVAFVRGSHKRGLTVICVVHGKGQHSEGGLGVLREAVVDALIGSGAAPAVYAFCSAPEVLGGSGALLIELKR